MALSSAKAMCRAASFAGCQSASAAPRSTSSIIWRSSSNAARSSTNALASRCRATMPCSGAPMACKWPVPIAESAVPPGPSMSTTRRPPKYRLSVRDVSVSICAHAASEMGASSRNRLFMPGVSFQGADAERAVGAARVRRCRGDCRFHTEHVARLIMFQCIQKCCRWREEQIPRHRAAEIEQPVVVARRTTHEHVLEHQLDGPRRSAVADEIGAEFTLPDAAEWHVVAQDFDLFSILDDRGQRAVRRGRLDRIVQLDVGQFLAADDAFLRLRRQRVPSGEIVQILLKDDVAGAGERAVFLPDHHGVGDGLATRVFGSVHEAEKVAIVEVLEAMHLVDR